MSSVPPLCIVRLGALLYPTILLPRCQKGVTDMTRPAGGRAWQRRRDGTAQKAKHLGCGVRCFAWALAWASQGRGRCVLGGISPRTGCGLLLEEKNPEGGELPNVERSRDQIAVRRGVKDSHPCERRRRIVYSYVQLVAAVDGQVRDISVDWKKRRSKHRRETLPCRGIKRHQGVSKTGINHNGIAFRGRDDLKVG